MKRFSYAFLGLESSISWRIRNFFRMGSFYILSSESSLLKYKKNMRLEYSISWNIRIFLILELESSISQNIRNFFGADFLKNIFSSESFLLLLPEIYFSRLENFVSQNTRKTKENIRNFFRVDFFLFLKLGLESGPCSP